YYKTFDYIYDFDESISTLDQLDIYPVSGTKDFSLNLGNNGSTYAVVGQASVADGVFTIDTGNTLLGSASGGRWYTAYSDGQTWKESGINFEQGYTIECKVKVIAGEELGSYSTAIMASAQGGTARAVLSIAENSTIWNGSEVDDAANTQWQIFRIVQLPNLSQFKVYRGADYNNMVEIFAGTGSSSTQTPYLNIGDGSSSFGGKVMFDYIAFTPGAYKPTPCGTFFFMTDLNMDCYVNLMDLMVIAKHWLQCTDPLDPINCVID
ncbi:MAG: hypothetical protein KAS23_12890, partial [Anaerohalosphaera sp.]|nr:hypothetical protein [Anaerohalosphaera sp.]